MAVIHILKDGTVTNDISGYVVKVEYAEPLYRLIETMNEEKEGKNGV